MTIHNNTARCYYSSYVEERLSSERVSNLSKVTQLMNGRELKERSILLQSPCSFQQTRLLSNYSQYQLLGEDAKFYLKPNENWRSFKKGEKVWQAQEVNWAGVKELSESIPFSNRLHSIQVCLSGFLCSSTCQPTDIILSEYASFLLQRGV